MRQLEKQTDIQSYRETDEHTKIQRSAKGKSDRKKTERETQTKMRKD